MRPRFVAEAGILCFNIHTENTKGLIIIVSKLYEYASAYDNEWAVPEFDDPSGDSESERRERSESISDGSEQFSITT